MSIIFCKNQPILTIGYSGSGGSSGSVIPGGSGTEIQYNNNGTFGAITGSSVSGSNIIIGGSVSSSNSVINVTNTSVIGQSINPCIRPNC